MLREPCHQIGGDVLHRPVLGDVGLPRKSGRDSRPTPGAQQGVGPPSHSALGDRLQQQGSQGLFDLGTLGSPAQLVCVKVLGYQAATLTFIDFREEVHDFSYVL